MKDSTRPLIQHVSIPRPPGSEAEARAFYGGLLGLAEVEVPEAVRHLNLVWFRVGEAELHLFEEAPDNRDGGAHLCLEVGDLESLRERLTAAGHATRDTIPIPGRPRFFCADPFGNRLELTRLEAVGGVARDVTAPANSALPEYPDDGTFNDEPWRDPVYRKFRHLGWEVSIAPGGGGFGQHIAAARGEPPARLDEVLEDGASLEGATAHAKDIIETFIGRERRSG